MTLPALTRSLCAALALTCSGISCAASPTVIAPRAAYPESPLWHAGRLFYVEYAANELRVWHDGVSASFWKPAQCGPSAVAEFGAAHLLVACYDTNQLVEIDADGVELRRIERDRDGRSFQGPNDFTPDGAGGVYFTTSGEYALQAPITGTVQHLTADGVASVLAETIHYANGLTRSHDGRQLLVAEMLAGRILEFPLLQDGTLGPRRVWARLNDIAPPTPHSDAYNGPDGMKAGADGNYYIAQNGSARVLVVNEGKRLVRQIHVPTPYVTNVGLGPDGAVYITGLFDEWHAPYSGAVYRWMP
ncbi:MAG: SMP-30/gluconolactonase/LRE family protein [Proteobacteria bacterium]|nr:SMP-30/gluconolactonase/LRE family protein [Pseudomonadota bacterium]